MTQTAKICKELITQGVKNIAQIEFNEQKWRNSSLKAIESFLNKICVIEPIATNLRNEDMFRLTHIITRDKYRRHVQHLDLSILKKYNTDIYLDTKGYYNICINGIFVSYKIYACPPRTTDIIRYIWTSLNEDKPRTREEYNDFIKTITQEIRM